MTTLAIRPPTYELKYDESNNILCDLTWEELKKTYKKNGNILCPCMNRSYNVTSTWYRAHFQSIKHTSWREQEQKKYIDTWGHIPSSEKRTEMLIKENRNLKKMYADLQKANEHTNEKLELANKHSTFYKKDNNLLKLELEDYNRILLELNLEILINNEIMKIELENLENTINKSLTKVNLRNLFIKKKSLPWK